MEILEVLDLVTLLAFNSPLFFEFSLHCSYRSDSTFWGQNMFFFSFSQRVWEGGLKELACRFETFRLESKYIT